jgi:glucosamine kinase
MSKPYYFGIDGGGTRSRMAIVDENLHVVAQVVGGSTNIYSVNHETVYKNLYSLVMNALETAGLTASSIYAGCLGSAGLFRPVEIELFTNYFHQILGNVPVKLCSDGEILLCGGLLSLEGYCLISGTGSLALGRFADGQVVRSGGLGYMIGDEGSAWWIAHEALSRSLRSRENRDLSSTMLPSLLKACGVPKAEDLVEYVHHTATKADIASLAPIVTNFAHDGDELAIDILSQAANELFLLVKSVVQRTPAISCKELVVAGGVLEHDEFVLEKLTSKLQQDLPSLVISSPKGTALQGACIIATA